MKRSLVMRVGALGDVVLTRRLSYSLFLGGFRTTLFAPLRHASLLAMDPWIDAVIDCESPAAAEIYSGGWPKEREPSFDLALVISNAAGLIDAARHAASAAATIDPSPRSDSSIARQWAASAAPHAKAFAKILPDLPVVATTTSFAGATVIHAGSGSPRKNWPVERFVEISHRLAKAGHRVVWTRGPADDPIPPSASSFGRVEHPAIADLAALLKSARLFVGNDSGVSHLAAALGARTVALFGPTDPTIWRPDGRRVSVLRPDSGVLHDLSVDSVWTSLGESA